MAVHAYDDAEHCKACGLKFPCPPWLAQWRDVARDPTGRQIVLDTYSDAPPHVRARMDNGLRESTWIEI